MAAGKWICRGDGRGDGKEQAGRGRRAARKDGRGGGLHEAAVEGGDGKVSSVWMRFEGDGENQHSGGPDGCG